MRLAYYLLLSVITAFAVFFCCLVGPAYAFRLYSGIGFNAVGPAGETLFLIAGGVIAPWAALWARCWVFNGLGGYRPPDANTAGERRTQTPDRHEPPHRPTWSDQRTPQH